MIKQLHNPHLLTPLSVDPARISPSLSSGKDEKGLDPNIVEWIERAQASVRQHATSGLGSYPTLIDGDTTDGDSDDDGVSKSGYGAKTERTMGALDPTSGAIPRKPSSTKLHSLPNESTPVGLLAGLSLEERKGKKSRAASAIETGEIPQPDAEEDRGVGIERPDYFQPGMRCLSIV